MVAGRDGRRWGGGGGRERERERERESVCVCVCALTQSVNQVISLEKMSYSHLVCSTPIASSYQTSSS